jgi:hypothetical protein
MEKTEMLKQRGLTNQEQQGDTSTETEGGFAFAGVTILCVLLLGDFSSESHRDYEELVRSLSSHANSLYEKLDTILD